MKFRSIPKNIPLGLVTTAAPTVPIALARKRHREKRRLAEEYPISDDEAATAGEKAALLGAPPVPWQAWHPRHPLLPWQTLHPRVSRHP